MVRAMVDVQRDLSMPGCAKSDAASKAWDEAHFVLTGTAPGHLASSGSPKRCGLMESHSSLSRYGRETRMTASLPTSGYRSALWATIGRSAEVVLADGAKADAASGASSSPRAPKPNRCKEQQRPD